MADLDKEARAAALEEPTLSRKPEEWALVSPGALAKSSPTKLADLLREAINDILRQAGIIGMLRASPSPLSPAAASAGPGLVAAIEKLPRYDGNGGAKLGESTIIPVRNGRYVALDDVLAYLAHAKPSPPSADAGSVRAEAR